MDTKVFLSLIFMISVSYGKLDESMFGAQGSELLKELKESGVIDQFEQELEKMLLQQKHAGETNEIIQEEIVPEINPITEFIDSYVEAKGITLDSRILEHLSVLPLSDEGEAKHFVHLTQVLDKIFELATLDDPEVDKKVLDVIKRVKSLPIMKISLNKLNEPTVEEVKKPEPVAQNELIDSGVIQMVVEFIKNIKKKPEFLLEIVLPMVEESGLVGKEVTSMAKIYGKSFVRSESFMYLIDSTADYIESLGKSPMGMRMIQMIPTIMQNVHDKEKLMDMFRAEAENNWDQFVGRLDNSDTIDLIVSSLAGSMVGTHGLFKGLMKDEMKMAIGNTFLISQGLPAIKPRKLTESLFDLAAKCIKVFTVWKLDLEPFKVETLRQISLVEKEYMSATAYGKLNEEEQKTLVARFLRENMVESFQHLWTINKHVTSHPEGGKCVESLLCHLNSHMKKQGPIKSEVTKVFSLAASFAWTMEQEVEDGNKIWKYGGNPDMDRWQLYKSIWNGHKPETDCSVAYTPTGKENICHILPWQSDVMMSLNFEHTEL